MEQVEGDVELPERGGFNPHSRETPSGTNVQEEDFIQQVSILTRGKPRVEPEGLDGLIEFLQVSILTRGKPRVEHVYRSICHSCKVSILTRGKPRVEHA